MNKILTFIIGLLCGAIIATLCFMLYLKSFQEKTILSEEMYKPGEEMRHPSKIPNGTFPNRPDFNK